MDCGSLMAESEVLLLQSRSSSIGSDLVGLLGLLFCVIIRGRANDFLRPRMGSIGLLGGTDIDVAGDRGLGVATVESEGLVHTSYRTISETTPSYNGLYATYRVRLKP